MKEYEYDNAKSIKVVILEEGGGKWDIDCEQVEMKTLVGDKVVVKGGHERMPIEDYLSTIPSK